MLRERMKSWGAEGSPGGVDEEMGKVRRCWWRGGVDEEQEEGQGAGVVAGGMDEVGGLEEVLVAWLKNWGLREAAGGVD